VLHISWNIELDSSAWISVHEAANEATSPSEAVTLG